jgi:hypothetical protein
MELRTHPLMSHRGVPSWPPKWVWIDGTEKQSPIGEVGTLSEVRVSNVPGLDQLFVMIDYLGSVYMGCLLFDDPNFCHEVHQLLTGHRGRPISQIAALELNSLR